MLESGRRQSDVANALGVSQSVINSLTKRQRETETVNERPRSGRPRKTSPADDRFLTLQARRHPLYTARQLSSELQNASDVRISCLMETNSVSRRPLKCLVLGPAQRQERLAWALLREDWQQEWCTTVFTDESRFGLLSDSRRIRIWIERDRPITPFRGGTIQVGICY